MIDQQAIRDELFRNYSAILSEQPDISLLRRQTTALVNERFGSADVERCKEGIMTDKTMNRDEFLSSYHLVLSDQTDFNISARQAIKLIEERFSQSYIELTRRVTQTIYAAINQSMVVTTTIYAFLPQTELAPKTPDAFKLSDAPIAQWLFHVQKIIGILEIASGAIHREIAAAHDPSELREFVKIIDTVIDTLRLQRAAQYIKLHQTNGD